VNPILQSRKKVIVYGSFIVAFIYLASVFVMPIGVSAFSAAPQVSTTPKVILKPFTVVAGKSVKVTGLHFTDGASITVTFNGGTVATTSANSTGGFVTSFVVPSSTPASTYTVSASDSNGLKASNTLTVTGPKAKLAVTATAHRNGASVTVVGSDFLPSTAITVTFNSVQVGTATSSSSGGFTVTFTIEDTPAGTFDIVATDGTNSVTKTFGVNAYVTVTPTAGAPGSSLTVEGTGFAPGVTVTITLGSTTVGSPTSNPYGAIQVTVVIPSTFSRGGETLTATDGTNSASAHVRVT